MIILEAMPDKQSLKLVLDGQTKVFSVAALRLFVSLVAAIETKQLFSDVLYKLGTIEIESLKHANLVKLREGTEELILMVNRAVALAKTLIVLI